MCALDCQGSVLSSHQYLLLAYFSFRWGILFSHPRDYTPVCTTELGRAAKLASEFAKRNVKMIALSIDDVKDHHGWCKVLCRELGHQWNELLFDYQINVIQASLILMENEQIPPMSFLCNAVFMICSFILRMVFNLWHQHGEGTVAQFTHHINHG